MQILSQHYEDFHDSPDDVYFAGSFFFGSNIARAIAIVATARGPSP
jgi:hypothetical protein